MGSCTLCYARDVEIERHAREKAALQAENTRLREERDEAMRVSASAQAQTVEVAKGYNRHLAELQVDVPGLRQKVERLMLSQLDEARAALATVTAERDAERQKVEALRGALASAEECARKRCTPFRGYVGEATALNIATEIATIRAALASPPASPAHDCEHCVGGFVPALSATGHDEGGQRACEFCNGTGRVDHRVTASPPPTTPTERYHVASLAALHARFGCDCVIRPGCPKHDGSATPPGPQRPDRLAVPSDQHQDVASLLRSQDRAALRASVAAWPEAKEDQAANFHAGWLLTALAAFEAVDAERERLLVALRRLDAVDDKRSLCASLPECVVGDGHDLAQCPTGIIARALAKVGGGR